MSLPGQNPIKPVLGPKIAYLFEKYRFIDIFYNPLVDCPLVDINSPHFAGQFSRPRRGRRSEARYKYISGLWNTINESVLFKRARFSSVSF